ncbi:hypothetical protein QAD02_015237 [Eretmocerus hayati]|uniref:Uncharacterized protein n=1 Tax=Eretmocerus hayati TaxID=131215 RepID=A0ACC2P780_9HYME|nr:hypothetical protein QAD02_015237 [Eretmocerus hayati]
MMLLSALVSSLLFIQLTRADTSVHILSSKYGHGQLITSSILSWISDSQYSASKDFVIGGFELVGSPDAPDTSKLPIFVCRALHNGIWVAGGQRHGDKRCSISFAGTVRTYQRYQLLENAEGAARVNWIDWSKLEPLPSGSVATHDRLYVARRSTVGLEGKSKLTHYIGTLYAQDSLGSLVYVKEDGQEGTADSGQLLVETEPISYDLTNVKLNQLKRHVSKRNPRVLAQATLKNTGSRAANLAEALDYKYQYSRYWGQGHAMLKGLNTTITMHNKTRLQDLKWGLEFKENRTGVQTVERYLEPGTAVNVTLRADYAYVEVPYSGKLFSRYEDGASNTPRTITGIRREEMLVDITADFGPVYYLANGTLVPISSTDSDYTITSSSNTGGSSGSSSSSNNVPRGSTSSTHQIDEESSGSSAVVDDNAIDRLPETRDMQADDGGPQSLKDKAENSAIRFFILPCGMLTVVIATIAIA